ncbi:MAG: hypothetical protein JOS17DRAFT_755291, partial [Linnemannia elongata]
MLRRGCPKRPRYIILRFFAQPPLFFGCTWTRAMSGGFFYSDAWHGTLENGRHGEKKNEGTVGLILITGSRRKCHPLLLAGREKKEIGGMGRWYATCEIKKKAPMVLFFGWRVFFGGYFLEGFGKMGKKRTLGVEAIQWPLFYIASPQWKYM